MISGVIDAAVHAAYPKSMGWQNKFEELDEKFLKEDLNNQLGSAILFSKEITKYFYQGGKESYTYFFYSGNKRSKV